MQPEEVTPSREGPDGGSFLRIGVAAAAAGAATGILGTLFRLALDGTHRLRDALVHVAHRWPSWGWLLPVVASGTAVALARLLVRLAPLAAGSGVQHVEAVERGEARPAGFRTLVVKFVGGILALGSGLALGREGPTVQMGALVGHEVGRGARLDPQERRDLLVAAAGAGLAVAFNAPVGGALFVLEEVTKGTRLRLSLMTLLAGGIAVAVSRSVLGDHPVFRMAPLPDVSLVSLLAFLALGAIAGVLGALYNRSVVAGLDLFARYRAIPLELRAALVGGLVGLLAWWSPSLVGSGDDLSQRILGGDPLPLVTLVGILGVRWVLGVGSYALGTPGGLFAPLLLLGASTGAILGNVLAPWAPVPLPATTAFAAVGMASFFAGMVRAPFTGLVLVVEMTASTALIVPMLVACFAAVAVATALREPPVYDTLRLRMLAATRDDEDGPLTAPVDR